MDNGKYRTYCKNNPTLPFIIYIFVNTLFLSNFVMIKMDPPLPVLLFLIFLISIQLYLIMNKFVDMMDFNEDEIKPLTDLSNV